MLTSFLPGIKSFVKKYAILSDSVSNGMLNVSNKCYRVPCGTMANSINILSAALKTLV